MGAHTRSYISGPGRRANTGQGLGTAYIGGNTVTSSFITPSQLARVLVIMTLALVGIIVGVILSATEEQPPAAVSIDAAVGKCIQGQRVFYQVDRGQSAEACLAQFDADPDKFERTWRNYDTEAGSW